MLETWVDNALQAFVTAGQNPWDLFVFLFINGGWILLFAVVFYWFFDIWVDARITQYEHRWRWHILAIDVPKENLQTPRAVENIFAHIAGTHETRDLVEKFYWGEYQRWMSFEIVSLEGYVQFLVRVETKNRETLEAAIYAQYPDAEITEVEDYMEKYPTHYPNPEWNCWGAEWVSVEDLFFPIRTYEDFEHQLEKDQKFKDPMAVLLEQITHIGKGEMAAIQIIVIPIGQKWKEGGFELAMKLSGQEAEAHEGFWDHVLMFPVTILKFIGSIFFGGEEEEEKYERIDWGAFKLTKGQRERVESVETKISKIGFQVKIRAIYIAKREIFRKARVHFGIVGFFKQFTREDWNGLKPDYKTTGTSAHYYMREHRKNLRRTRLAKAFKERSEWRGRDPTILNIAELATLWHFPMSYIRAPMLSKTETRRVEPPDRLPLAPEEVEYGGGLRRVALITGGKEAPPTRLPFAS